MKRVPEAPVRHSMQVPEIVMFFGHVTMQIHLIPGAIAELFAQASASGKLSLADRYALMAAILDESLSEDERRAVDRLLRSISKGQLVPVDELSVVR
ncbi:hypothetical protein ACQ4M4_20455 [Leptolyngbya sp. AN02str]|uniref:hypothetical protein n=1 Tax=Leptolyngbya sp. AN02str TaxID=3423363 RepID=UPI003D30F292